MPDASREGSPNSNCLRPSAILIRLEASQETTPSTCAPSFARQRGTLLCGPLRCCASLAGCRDAAWVHQVVQTRQELWLHLARRRLRRRFLPSDQPEELRRVVARLAYRLRFCLVLVRLGTIPAERISVSLSSLAFSFLYRCGSRFFWRTCGFRITRGRRQTQGAGRFLPQSVTDQRRCRQLHWWRASWLFQRRRTARLHLPRCAQGSFLTLFCARPPIVAFSLRSRLV